MLRDPTLTRTLAQALLAQGLALPNPHQAFFATEHLSGDEQYKCGKCLGLGLNHLTLILTLTLTLTRCGKCKSLQDLWQV